MKANPRTDIVALRQAYPIPEVAGATMQLTRRGEEWHGCCPFHADRSPSFTIFAGGMRFHCFGCGASGDVLDFIQRQHGIGLREAIGHLAGGTRPAVSLAPPPLDNHRHRITKARELWEAAQPAEGTLAETYLRSRGLYLTIPASIRFARLPYGKAGREYPALVAAVASADDHLVGVQRIYLSDCGTAKAAVPKAKLSLGRISGCAIRLAPAARRLVVTEGLEDGLTLQQEQGRSVWVCCGASMMPKMLFPVGVEEVIVGGDNDPPGEAAARKAVCAFRSRGLSARAFFPLAAKDFNAELMERLGS